MTYSALNALLQTICIRTIVASNYAQSAFISLPESSPATSFLIEITDLFLTKKNFSICTNVFEFEF